MRPVGAEISGHIISHYGHGRALHWFVLHGSSDLTHRPAARLRDPRHQRRQCDGPVANVPRSSGAMAQPHGQTLVVRPGGVAPVDVTDPSRPRPGYPKTTRQSSQACCNHDCNDDQTVYCQSPSRSAQSRGTMKLPPSIFSPFRSSLNKRFRSVSSVRPPTLSRQNQLPNSSDPGAMDPAAPASR